MKLLRSHGITRDKQLFTSKCHGDWHYEQHHLGFNYRMTDFQAALGCSQLKSVEKSVEVRNAIAKKYAAELGDVIASQLITEGNYSSYHLYVVRVEPEKRRYIFDGLTQRGIGVNLHYIPIYLHPYYRRLGFQEGHCPNSEKYYHSAITLPIFPSLGHGDFKIITNAIHELI